MTKSRSRFRKNRNQTLRSAWSIDTYAPAKNIGPEGGSGGGKVVAEGTPEEVAKAKNSFTGDYLKKMI